MAARVEEREAAPEISLADIAALIKDSRETIATLQREVAELRTRTPEIRPMERPADPAIARRAAVAAMVKGKEVAGALGQEPTDYRGQPVAPSVARPRFDNGAAVRIRADIPKEGLPRKGDPFPIKWDVDIRGKRRIARDWSMWSRIFPGLKEDGDEFPRDVVWGDILTVNRCSGEGKIAYPGVMSRAGYWKYRVKVPGLTQEWGDSFYEYELSPADGEAS